MSVLKHIQAIVLLPIMAIAVVPMAILFNTWGSTSGRLLSFPLNFILPLIGIVLIGLGLILMAGTIKLFATVGKGTLAPWAPPGNLVVRGVYRHVRNPMISGVFSVLIGEALLLASIPLFIWFLLFAIINMIYIPLFEERGLEGRFGPEYLFYKKNVPRWVPRRKPWKAPDREDRPL